MFVPDTHTCTSILMYTVQVTNPFPRNYFAHAGRKAIESKGDIEEHFIKK